MQVRDASGTLRTIASVSARDTASALKAVSGIYVRDSGAVLRTISGGGSLSATLSPANLYGYGYSPGAINVTTGGSGTVSITGGTPPYTVDYTLSESGWEAVSPSSLVTPFRSPPLSGSEESNTLIYATVQDALSNVVITNTISAFCQNAYEGP